MKQEKAYKIKLIKILQSLLTVKMFIYLILSSIDSVLPEERKTFRIRHQYKSK